jgi:hypothetical protein
MSNVIALGGLPIAKQAVNEGLVKALHNALEMAKTGELQCFVGTGLLSSADRLSIFSIGQGENIFTLYGAVSMLQAELFQRQAVESEA